MCCRHVGFVGLCRRVQGFLFVGLFSVLVYVSAPVSDMYGSSNVDYTSVYFLQVCRQPLSMRGLSSSAAYIIIKTSQICT